MTRLPRTIVIVGAGFSGTAVAVNLLRLSYWMPVRVVLVERAERMARGAAYAERAHPYLLNVPAGRMSLNSSDPLEFLKFAQTRVPEATADDFLPRSLYGEYLEASLRDAELRSPSHVHLHRIRGDVCAVERIGTTTSHRVELGDGSSFVADEVVLAMGNPPPAQVPGTEPLLGTPQYISDPWSSSPNFQPGETVLVIGTGLTMADTVLAGSEATPPAAGAGTTSATRADATSAATSSEVARPITTHAAAVRSEAQSSTSTHGTPCPASSGTTSADATSAVTSGEVAQPITTHAAAARSEAPLGASTHGAPCPAATGATRADATSAISSGEVAQPITTHDAAAADDDAARRLSAPGHVTFHAISRRGLVPPSQTAFRHAGCDDNGVVLLRAASVSARRLVRAVRELTAEVESRGGDWREAITCVRSFAPALWQRLSTRERQRFLRHARPYWDVHRHRLPQETLAKLQDLQRADQFHVHAGRILKFELIGEKVRVTWRARRTDDVQTLIVDRVINCTGADYNPNRSRDPLMRSLLAQGLATSDALGLGLRTSNYGALLDSHNRVASNLYYIGPMLRADHWECTAAQELRVHAERLAHHLAAPAIKPVFAAARRAPESATRDLAHPRDLTPTLTSALTPPTARTI